MMQKVLSTVSDCLFVLQLGGSGAHSGSLTRGAKQNWLHY